MISFVKERLEIIYLSDSDLSVLPDDGLEVIEGLTEAQKSLPPRYFYDQKGSQIFEQICSLPEYYPTRTEAAILKTYAPEIAQITGPCELVELGSGSSKKTRLLLDAYQSLAYPLVYVPIDVSKTIVEETATELLQDYQNLEIQALIGPYELALAQLNHSSLNSRMICFLGSTLGNFNETECNLFFEKIRETLNPGDYFLLGIDLEKELKVLEAAYNDSQGVTAQFNLNILRNLNRIFEGNFDLNNFEHWAFYNQHQSQIEMHLIAKQDHKFQLKKLNFQGEIAKDSTILTEISRKFNLETMVSYLENQNLNHIKAWQDEQQWFAILLCQKL